jgi:hypothetical protein
MGLIEKRTAVLARSVRTRRLNLVDALGAAVELGLTLEDVVALVDRCANVTDAADRVERISALLVCEYAGGRLHFDEVVALAAELGFDEDEVVALIDECGAADLAA